jgi:hypothetical protein
LAFISNFYSLKGAAAAAAVEWTEEKRAAFEAAKQLLADVACLAHPEPQSQLCLAVDASDSHIGGVLQQSSPLGWQPLAFFSKKLDGAQTRYSTFDRELLACHDAVRHFRWSLEGRVFHVLTDHKPLTFALTRTADAWSARQQRQLLVISEYTTDIRHVAGCENVVADVLSRPTAAVEPADNGDGVDYAQLASDQLQCEEVQQLMQCTSLRVLRVRVYGHDIYCDVSAAPRPLVPRRWVGAVFRMLHNLSHPGIRATRRLITSRFVWKNCAAEIAELCRRCMGCARGKPGGELERPAVPIPIPVERFSHVHVDLVGPLPASVAGHTHIMTMVDRTTRWPEAVPLKDVTTGSCVEVFQSCWVSRFGLPRFITTDRGVQFTSAAWKAMCSRIGDEHIVTTAYHPQSNGLVERLHRQLKEALRAHGGGGLWVEHLPWVLLGIRAAPKEGAGVSAAEAVYGAPLAVPGQLVRPPEPEGQPEIPGTTPEPEPVQPEEISDLVFVKRPGKTSLGPLFDGPFKVLSRKEKMVRIQFGSYAD